jgi:hypothetical protein
MSFVVNARPPKLDVWKMDAKGTLYLSESLMHEIEYLHREVGAIEWCGPLLYEKLEGDLAEPETLKIRAHHVFPMDIGSPGYTAATLSGEDMVALYEQYPQLIESGWKQGLIHTHHTMNTFFSGTDMDELHENTPNHNYYLSLIVNFDGNWMAKVAFIASLKQTSNNLYTFKSTDDEEASFENSTEAEKQVLMTIDMNIVKEGSDIISQEFKARFQRLKEEKRKRTYNTNSYVSNVYAKPAGGTGVHGASGGSSAVSSGVSGGTPYKGEQSMEQGDLYQDIKDTKSLHLRPPYTARNQEQTQQNKAFGQDSEDGWVEPGNRVDAWLEQERKKIAEKSNQPGFTLSGKLDRMNDVTAAEAGLEWLKTGCMPELGMKKRGFTSIREGIEYFDDFFKDGYDDNYEAWISAMQDYLYQICKDYSPAIVALRMQRNLEFLIRAFRVAKDLHRIAEDYPQYYQVVQRNKIVVNG